MASSGTIEVTVNVGTVPFERALAHMWLALSRWRRSMEATSFEKIARQLNLDLEKL